MAISGSQYILWEYEEVIVYRDRSCRRAGWLTTNVWQIWGYGNISRHCFPSPTSIWWDCVTSQSQGYIPCWCWVYTLMYHSPFTLIAVGKEQPRTREAWAHKRKWGAAWPIILESDTIQNNCLLTKSLWLQQQLMTLTSWWLPLSLTTRTPAGSSTALYPPSTAPRATVQSVLHCSRSVSPFCFYYCILRAHWRQTNNLARNSTHSVKDWPAPCPPHSSPPPVSQLPWKAGDLCCPCSQVTSE